MPEAISLPARPETRLGATAEVTTQEQAELALIEIAWCNAVKAAAFAHIDEKMRKLNETLVTMQVAAIGEDAEDLAAHRNRLEETVMKWAESHRSTLCPGAKKSVQLRNGRLKWRAAKDAVDFADGSTQKTAVETIGNDSGLLAKIESLIDELNWYSVFQAKLSVNKTAAVKARQKLQVTDEQLAEVGLEFKAGDEYITVEPVEFVRIAD